MGESTTDGGRAEHSGGCGGVSGGGGEVGGELNGGASSGRGAEHTVWGTAADRPARRDAIDDDGVYDCVAPDAAGM